MDLSKLSIADLYALKSVAQEEKAIYKKNRETPKLLIQEVTVRIAVIWGELLIRMEHLKQSE